MFTILRKSLLSVSILIGLVGTDILVSPHVAKAQDYVNPESAPFDIENNRYLISNWGNGTVVQIDSAGTISQFYSGLDRPLGMTIFENILYVACYTTLVGLDLTTSNVVMSLLLSSTGVLNDVTADSSGYLYVTNSGSGFIYRIRIADQTSETIASGYNRPNGILFNARSNRIVFCEYAPDGRIWAINPEDLSISLVLTTGIDNLDGLTMDTEGYIYVSSWATNGVHRYDNAFSFLPELISTGHSGPADIYFNRKDRLLAVPNFNSHTVDFIPIPAVYINPHILAEPNTGNAPVTIQFTDMSYARPEITSRAWDFDNDGTFDSEEQNPIWVYEEPGIYTVRFEASNDSLTETFIGEDYIHIFDGECALLFNGQDSYASCPASPSLHLTDSFTIEAWINPSGWGEFQTLGLGRIVDKSTISLYLIESYSPHKNHSMVLELTHADETVSYSNTSAESIVLGEWQHIAATYNGQDAVKIFINGVEQTVSTTPLPSVNIKDNGEEDLIIGNSFDLGRTFDGIIDEVRIWNVNRSSDDIQQHMESYVSENESGLVGYWKMNEGNGESIFDNSPSENNGTVFDAAWREGVHLSPPSVDSDEDGVVDCLDNCPHQFNPEQEDGDEDGLGNVCDNCPDDANADQTDGDADGIGDVCDTCMDTDGDGFGDPGYPANTCVEDNCPDVYNPDQTSVNRGDINCKDGINVLDVLSVVNHILGTSTLIGEPLERADCNDDGKVNIVDALGIVNVILGIGECAPNARPVVNTEVVRYCRSLEPYLSAEKFSQLMVLVKSEMRIPTEYVLSQNYPNPFNPKTTIRFTLPHISHVRLAIYNITGELVKTLANSKYAAGHHLLIWDGTDECGQNVSSGIYFCKMETVNFCEIKSMVLLK